MSEGKGPPAPRRVNGKKLPAVNGLRAEEAAPEALARKRRMVADFCRLMGEQLTGQPALPPPARSAEEKQADERIAALPPRVQQTLHRLLAGDSEKEIAIRLDVSRHTIHVYVKTLYRHFGVNSRGELLAHFVANAYRVPRDIV